MYGKQQRAYAAYVGMVQFVNNSIIVCFYFLGRKESKFFILSVAIL